MTISKPGPSTQRGRARKAAKAWRALKMQIWHDKPHECEICGEGLGNFPHAHYFSHKRHRGAGGNPAGDKNVAENIELLCRDCHDEHGGVRHKERTAPIANATTPR